MLTITFSSYLGGMAVAAKPSKLWLFLFGFNNQVIKGIVYFGEAGSKKFVSILLSVS